MSWEPSTSSILLTSDRLVDLYQFFSYDVSSRIPGSAFEFPAFLALREDALVLAAQDWFGNLKVRVCDTIRLYRIRTRRFDCGGLSVWGRGTSGEKFSDGPVSAT